ncbi:uncharacterized protein LOC117102877 isoform X2 [Anneissia japonica]|uniref:uncharacterized protein LOC117102877 isoform X2 n=1 Tax=Anneissia japonica TaxID=1529436 RepID=UPI0014259F8D|nr:uncharacterized protein LOC117102877 isoform X2 [Anneissia japonica]
MIRTLVFACIIGLLFILEITGADVVDSSECDGFLLDSNCYIVIIQAENNLYDSSSSSFSFPDFDLNVVKTSWKDAKDRCEDNGTNLASIPNNNVQYSLAAYLKLVHPETSLFIGLRRKENEDIWRWDDTSKATQYTNWNTKRMQPTIKNGACAGVYMDTYDGFWYDARCTNSILEYKNLKSTGALCQYKISSKITSAPGNIPLQGNGSVTSAPVNTPLQCNEYVYMAVIIAQSIIIIALLITLLLYCKKRKCTATGENQTNRNEHFPASKMTERNPAASEDTNTNMYDIPRNAISTEDDYEVYDQPPNASRPSGSHNNPTYDMTAMDENNYMQPMPTQSEYMELDVNH